MLVEITSDVVRALIVVVAADKPHITTDVVHTYITRTLTIMFAFLPRFFFAITVGIRIHRGCGTVVGFLLGRRICGVG
jgi:hypothetical protein